MLISVMLIKKSCRLEEDFKVIIWGPSQKGLFGTIFYMRSRPLDTPSKDFHLAIGSGLGWIKWLKNEAEKGFIFHAIFRALYPFW